MRGSSSPLAPAVRRAVPGLMLGLLLVAGAAAPTAAAAPKKARVVYIQPLCTQVKAADLARVVRALTAFTSYPVKILPPQRLAGACSNDVNALLDGLKPPADAFRVVGVTGVALVSRYYPRGGPSGRADPKRGRCIISTAGAPLDAASRLKWLGQVVLHELGHTWGLTHCTSYCIMYRYASSTGMEFCPRCRARLAAQGFALRPEPTIPWKVLWKVDRAKLLRPCGRSCVLELIK